MTTVNQVSALAKSLVDSNDKIKSIEKELKEAKERSRYLREESIPTMMQEAGVESLTLDTGQKLTIKKEIYASITEENKTKALGWLEAHGLSGIIKSVVKVEFNRGELSAANEVTERLSMINIGDRFLEPEFKEHVHPTTLRATLKVEIAQGRPVPADLFSIRSVMEAKIK